MINLIINTSNHDTSDKKYLKILSKKYKMFISYLVFYLLNLYHQEKIKNIYFTDAKGTVGHLLHLMKAFTKGFKHLFVEFILSTKGDE